MTSDRGSSAGRGIRDASLSFPHVEGLHLGAARLLLTLGLVVLVTLGASWRSMGSTHAASPIDVERRRLVTPVDSVGFPAHSQGMLDPGRYWTWTDWGCEPWDSRPDQGAKAQVCARYGVMINDGSASYDYYILRTRTICKPTSEENLLSSCWAGAEKGEFGVRFLKWGPQMSSKSQACRTLDISVGILGVNAPAKYLHCENSAIENHPRYDIHYNNWTPHVYQEVHDVRTVQAQVVMRVRQNSAIYASPIGGVFGVCRKHCQNGA